MPYIAKLGDAGASSEAEFGSKAAALAKLVREGFPVPNGFVVSSSAMEKFVEANGLREKASAICAAANLESMAHAEGEIKKLFLEAKLPEDVITEILSAYDGMQPIERGPDMGVAMEFIKAGRDNETVAVRASPVRKKSFAGVLRNHLHVTGKESLLNSIKMCWASGFYPFAAFYREQTGLDDEPFGIVVQKMIESEKAGTAYISETDSLIESSWDVGCAVSLGIVIPDEYGSAGGSVLRRIGRKPWTFRRNALTGKTERLHTPSAQMTAESLDAAELERLSDMLKKAGYAFPNPVVIDWCVHKRRVYLLDARKVAFGLPRDSGDDGSALVRGRCARQGVASGAANSALKENGGILLSKLPGVYLFYMSPAGVVTDLGGRLCNMALLSHEFGVPALVAAGNATEVIKHGEEVCLDAGRGVMPPGAVTCPPSEEQEAPALDALPMIQEGFQSDGVQPDNAEFQPDAFPSFQSAAERPADGPEAQSGQRGTGTVLYAETGTVKHVEGADGVISRGFGCEGSVSLPVYVYSNKENLPQASDFAAGRSGTKVLAEVSTSAEADALAQRMSEPSLAVNVPSLLVSGRIPGSVSKVFVDLKSVNRFMTGRDGSMDESTLKVVSGFASMMKQRGASVLVSVPPEFMGFETVYGLLKSGIDGFSAPEGSLSGLRALIERAERKLMMESSGREDPPY